MTLRFDHSSTGFEPIALPVDTPAPIPGRSTDFPAPLFSTAIVTLMLSVFGLNSISLFYPQVIYLQDLALYVYVPMAISGVAAHAWASGKLRNWWNYEEA